MLEHIWIRDIVDLAWEVFRLRRLEAGLMSAAAHEGMAQVLEPLWTSRLRPKVGPAREADVQKVEAALVDAGLTIDAVAARTFSARIGDFERIERMTGPRRPPATPPCASSTAIARASRSACAARAKREEGDSRSLRPRGAPARQRRHARD